MNNKKLLLLLGVLIIFAAIFIFENKQPSKNIPVTKKPNPTGSEGTINKNNSLTEKKSQPPSVDNSSTIVELKNEQSKKEFLQANNTSQENLTNITGTNYYVIKINENKLILPSGINNYPNVIYHATATPNDTYYSSQWNLQKVSVPTAWDITVGSPTTEVALIDTGFALSHEDLSANFDTSNAYDFVHGDADPSAGTDTFASAYVDHGTATAGLLSAQTNNSKGIASIGWSTKILPIQAMGDDGTGYTSTVASAINYAVSKNVKVISMSLGSTSSDPVLEASINSAISKGVIVVAASGNDGCNCINYPANYPSVIAVGATNSSDTVANFSNYGSNLDIVAPGSGTIYTTSITATNNANYYISGFNGTSASTPQVAASAALIKNIKPNATATEVESYIRNGADKVSGMSGQSFTNNYGYGRLNVKKSVDLAAASIAPPSDTYAWEFVNKAAYTDSLKNNSLNLSQLNPGQQGWLVVSIKNTGSSTWQNTGINKVYLSTDVSLGRTSMFATNSWLSSSVPANLKETSVLPGDIGTFEFPIKASSAVGNFKEYFRPLANSITNFSNSSNLYFDIAVYSAINKVPVYRHFNPRAGEHFYTTNLNESLYIRNLGWAYEGISWQVSSLPSTTPIYRHYNPSIGKHFYTSSLFESNDIRNKGWNYEGIAWYSSEVPTSTPIYRHYSPSRRAHFYTTNLNESLQIRPIGWNFEGISYYGF